MQTEDQQQEPQVVEDQQQPIEQPQGEPEAKQEEAKQEETEGDESSDKTPPRDEKGRFKSPLQERIDEITRERRRAEREALYWRERAQAAAQTQAQPNSPQGAETKPAREQFSDPAEYVEALASWKARQELNDVLTRRDAEMAQTAQQRAEAARVEAWSERVNDARTKIPDFDEVVGSSEVFVAPHVQAEMLESENGPALAYHFAKNPELVQRLNGLSPRDVVRAIAKLESDLPEIKPAARPVSKTPAPATPITTGRASTTDPSKMSHEQYRAWRASQGARWAK